MTVRELGQLAKNATLFMSCVTTEKKNEALLRIASALEDNVEKIIKANSLDLEAGKQDGLSDGLLDRLMLNEDRIFAMADGVRQVAALPDPCGKIIS